MENASQHSGIDQLEKAFFNDGYNLAKQLVEEDDPDTALHDAVSELYGQIDAFTDLFLENALKKGSPAHCKEGCYYCCHQAVFAQDYEIRYLKRWMFEHFSHQQLEDIRSGAREKRARTSVLGREEQLLFRGRCPLLSVGKCLAYEARPVACRIYLSKSVESCIRDHENPGDPDHFPQLFELILRLGRKMNQGFAARLSELGVETTEHAVEAGLLRS